MTAFVGNITPNVPWQGQREVEVEKKEEEEEEEVEVEESSREG